MSKMGLELKLAVRFLLSRRRGFLSIAAIVSVLGLAFGVASLLIALSVVSGFQREYKRSILSFNSHLVLMNADEIEDPQETMRRLEKYQPLEKLVGSTPFLYREGLVISGETVKGIVFKGVDFEGYGRLSHMKITRRAPAENKERLPEIVLGKTLAEELRLKDPILRVLFPSGLKPEDAGVKNVKRFFVTGTFESGLYEYDSGFAFLNLPDAQGFFKTGGRVSGIEIWLEDPEKATIWAEAMRNDFTYPYAVMTWGDLNENLFRALEVEKVIFSILLTVLIAVSALNVLGTLMMLLLERRGEVAILRAVGLPWRRLRKIFIFDGLLIGSLGTALGLILGLGVLFFLDRWRPIHLAPEVYFVTHVPVSWDWVNVVWVVLASLGILLVGCEWAMRRVTRVNLTRSLQEA